MLDITDEDHKRRTARANEREIKKKAITLRNRTDRPFARLSAELDVP